MLTSEQAQSIREQAERYIPQGKPLIEYPCYYHEEEIEKAYIAAKTEEREKVKELLDALGKISQEYHRENAFQRLNLCKEIAVEAIENYNSQK